MNFFYAMIIIMAKEGSNNSRFDKSNDKVYLCDVFTFLRSKANGLFFNFSIQDLKTWLLNEAVKNYKVNN